MLRAVLALAMVAIGVAHFAAPEPFLKIVPAWMPAPLALVYLSGVAEVAGGLGVLHPRTRSMAGWGLVALYVAVFPANINMAVNEIQLGPEPMPVWQMWARLPFQVLFIAWAWWTTRPDGEPAVTRPDEAA